MTLSRALRGVVVGALAATVALSGCTADEPEPEPTTTTAAATGDPTAEPTPEPPAIAAPEKPPVMATNDAVGARAAAEYFLSLYGYVFQTGDLTEWDAMCDPASEFCNAIHADVAENTLNGFSQAGGDLTFTVDRVVEPSGQLESYEIVGVTSQSSFELRGADGSLSTSGPGESDTPTSVFVYMSPEGQWQVRAVVVGGAQ